MENRGKEGGFIIVLGERGGVVEVLQPWLLDGVDVEHRQACGCGTVGDCCRINTLRGSTPHLPFSNSLDMQIIYNTAQYI